MKSLQNTLRRQVRLYLGLLFLVLAVSPALTDAATVPVPTWVEPAAMSLKKTGSIQNSGQSRQTFVDNQACQTEDTLVKGTGQISTGCYVHTAYGSLDVISNLVSFGNSGSTVIPLEGYGPHDVILPWPESASAVSVTPAPYQGVYLGLYRDVVSASADVRNLAGQVVAKKLSRPADFTLQNSSGDRLLANFNGIAFSDNGAWMVAEGLDGYFVRINLATQTVKPFARSFVGGGGRHDQSQIAISPDGKNIAIANSGAGSLRVYDLGRCTGQTDTKICKSTDYWPFIRSQAGSFSNPVHLRFINSKLLGFTDVANNTETDYLVSPTSSISSFTDYIALGDSYTSGEGAYAYRPGTDTETNHCRNSSLSYPALLTKSLYRQSGGNSVACSGAKIQDVVNNTSYFGQVDNGKALKDRAANDIQQYLKSFSPGYLPQIAFVTEYQPGAVTVSVGGNDIGFGNILQLCVAPGFSRHITNANDCLATYEDRLELAQLIDAQAKRLTALFKKVQSSAPASTIYAIGYPLIAVDTGNCALNVHLNTSEIALSIEIIKQLNGVVERSAKAANVSYVDIEEALKGHRLCETKSNQIAVHGVTSGTDGGLSRTIAGRKVAMNFLGKESFHPNAFGHELIASAIRLQTQDLKVKSVPKITKPPATTPNSKILKAPKINRAVVKKQPGSITKTKSAPRGSKVPITLKGKQKGLRPKATYKVILKDGQTTSNLGNVTTNDEADLEGTLIPLPIIQSGNYEIGIIGEDQLGETTLISDVITIIDSETDFDGDGLPNDTDSCLTIFNAGVDEDVDGIDDVCDPVIEVIANIPVAGTGSVAAPPPPNSSSLTPVSPTPSFDTGALTDLAVSPISAAPFSGLRVVAMSPRQQVLGAASTVSNVKPTVQGRTTVPQPTMNPVGANPNFGLQASSAVMAPELFKGDIPYVSLWRIPWVQILLALLLVLALIGALNSVVKKWRRERDSNPRYP